MRKTWLMCRYTYARRVRSANFLVLTLLVPALMVVVGVLIFMQNRPDDTPQVIGLVDTAGVLAPVDQVMARAAASRAEGGAAIEQLTLKVYAKQSEAQSARAAGEIDGYLFVPEDYPNGSSPIAYYSDQAPSDELEDLLAAYVRRALLPDAEPWVWARLDEPSRTVHVVPARNLALREGPGLVSRVAAPAALGLVFAFLIFTGANQMGPVVVQEKEKRALEMVITSMTTRQLVSGKVLGMALLSMTQVGVWAVGGLAALLLAAYGSFDLAELHIPWAIMGWGAVLGVLGYFLFAMLAAGLGIIAGNSRQAQQFAGVLGLFAIAPLWFAGVLVQAPAGRSAVILTIFPLTSPTTTLFRMALTDVPLWQLATAVLLLVLSLLASVWVVARLFRSSMLLYGQALRPRQVLQALLGG